MKCEICNKEFSNNTGGQLTNHLLKYHDLSLENYVVLTKFNNVAPYCKCGLCNERPFFNRGKFSDFALNHNSFEFREKKFLEKFGNPKCLNCEKIVKFYRGNPQKCCSRYCASKIFTCFAKSEIKERNKFRIRKSFSMSDQGKANISKSIKKKWEDPIYKEKTSAAIKKSLNTDFIRKFRSEQMLSLLASGCRTSKLHLKIRSLLNLESLGFKSEQRFSKYCVDELCENKKIIIEINGDYIHANPVFFAPDDIITIGNNAIFAKDKWNSDLKRKESLEKLGYNVFVIWESDNLEIKRLELEKLLIERSKM